LENTRVVREFLPVFLKQKQAKSLLDLPCGDLYWMKNVDIEDVEYFGADIVPEIIELNRNAFAHTNRKFLVLDIAKDALPAVDVILVRDCFIHLPNKMILEALRNIRHSPIQYLITTTYSEVSENIDIELGGFRHLNLQKPPFNLPKPEQMHREVEGSGKSLGIWKVSDLP
jgi:hypothetical protein